MTLAELRELLLPGLGEDLTDRTLDALVRLAPGDVVYVPRRARPPEIGPEDTPATIQRRYKVSRATAYNWVSKCRRQS